MTDRAIVDYNEKPIDLDPNYAEAYYNRGSSYIENRDDNRAIEDYNKAIDLKPDYVKAYYNRARVYFNNGDVHGSIR